MNEPIPGMTPTPDLSASHATEQEDLTHVGPNRSTAHVRFLSVIAGVASVLYASLAAIGSLTSNRNWGDRSPAGIALFTLVWLSLAGAFAFGLAAIWRTGKQAHDTTYNPGLTALPTLPSPSSNRWLAGGVLLAGLAALATLYTGAYRPGMIVGGDWGTWAYQPQADRLFPFPSLWNFSDLGSSNLAGTSSYLLESAAGLLGHLGINYGIAERVFFYVPVLLLGYFGIYFLVRRTVGGDILPVAVAVFFMGSVPVVAFFIGGWFTILAGAVLLPWDVIALERYLERPSALRAIAIGITFGLAAWFDPRNIYLDGIAILTYIAILLLGATPRQIIRRVWHLTTLLAPAVLIALQAQWLIPYIAGLHPAIPTSYFTASASREFSFNSLGDGLSSFNYAWPILKTGVPQPIPWLWAAVPLAAAVALWTCPRSRFVLFAIATYLLYALLAAGAQPPFGYFYTQIFLLVPGVDLYRDTSPYLVPATILSTFLVAVAIGATTRPLLGYWRHHSNMRIRSLSATTVVGIVLVVSCTATTITTFVTIQQHPQRLSGDLNTVAMPTWYRDANAYLATQPPGSTLWVPSTSGFALRGLPTHPNISATAIASQLGIPNSPGSVPGLWTANVPLLTLAFDLYHIRYIVVRTHLTAYNLIGNQLEKETTAELIKPLSHYLCRTGCQRMGSLVIANANRDAAGALSVVNTTKLMNRHAASASHATLIHSSGISPLGVLGNQCLASTSFGEPNLGTWHPVGNGDNFARLSLQASGVSEKTQPNNAIQLTVSSGAATIGQELSRCSTPHGVSEWEIQVRYRSYRNDFLQASIYYNDSRNSECRFPSSRKWYTATCIIAEPSAGPVDSDYQSELQLILSLFPANNTQVPFAPKSKVLISNVSVKKILLSKMASILSRQPAVVTSTRRVGSTTPLDTLVSALMTAQVRPQATETESKVSVQENGVDNWDIHVPRSRESSRILVLWQSYDTRWVALDRTTGRLLQHVEIDGWANGYILPRGINNDIAVSVGYSGQHILDLSMITEWCILGLLFMYVGALIVWKHWRHPN